MFVTENNGEGTLFQAEFFQEAFIFKLTETNVWWKAGDKY